MIHVLTPFCIIIALALPGCDRADPIETTAVKAVEKTAVNFFNRDLNFEMDPLHAFKGWAYYCANAAGLFIIIGLLMLMWYPNKTAARRMILTGLVFAASAKGIELTGVFLDKWGWLFFAGGIIAAIWFSLPWIEKMLCRFGWCVDLNGDKKYGTDRFHAAHIASEGTTA